MKRNEKEYIRKRLRDLTSESLILNKRCMHFEIFHMPEAIKVRVCRWNRQDHSCEAIKILKAAVEGDPFGDSIMRLEDAVILLFEGIELCERVSSGRR